MNSTLHSTANDSLVLAPARGAAHRRASKHREKGTGHVVFSGGGTAGHLFPGLAVAARLRQMAPEVRVTFAGIGTSLERDQVRQAGFDFVGFPSRPLPERPWHAVRFVRDHWNGARAAARFIAAQQVTTVVGLGGFASVPMARAALKARLPLVLLEQNAVAGRATRWLAPRATLICAAFGEATAQLTRPERVRVVGNPLRPQFAELFSAAGELKRRPLGHGSARRLVVLGGTSGAELLNKQVPRALYKLGVKVQGWEVLHQSGPRGLEQTRVLYGKLGLKATVVPFFSQMAGVLASSELAISRAGGSTLSELAACGVPGLLVPYPQAIDDHQRRNAEVFEAAGAARIVDARKVIGRFDNALADALAPLVLDGVALRRMSLSALRLARPWAATTVAELVLAQLRATA